MAPIRGGRGRPWYTGLDPGRRQHEPRCLRSLPHPDANPRSNLARAGTSGDAARRVSRAWPDHSGPRPRRREDADGPVVNLEDYDEVWGVDFEFVARPGERPDPVCLVARELRTGRT